ncbi:bacterial transferase hexapeptide domain containing protein [Musa troglodytarum]|uniref:Bacterial transferase hexapeptide domain containing protein n=1 Tax=Musa troglodytarum TaxID=320322 RepID=A0A9E7K822_9LILI|nr:bacterial transferase hexapeptide domain containing protein [Musa troglodytarum]
MGTLGRAIYAVGCWIRETGQAIDRLGCRLQGNYLFQEQLSRHRTLMNIFDKVPNVHKDAFVAPSASVIGDVQVGQRSSIWYGCVLRGHSAVLHGCTVEDEAFVGMGAVLLDGSVVEKHGMVAAGALVWGGNPAKFLRKLTDEEIAFISESAANFANLAQVHAAENVKSFDEIEFEKVLRKKFARRDEEYDSMLGVVREVPSELILPDNILPDKSPEDAAVGSVDPHQFTCDPNKRRHGQTVLTKYGLTG